MKGWVWSHGLSPCSLGSFASGPNHGETQHQGKEHVMDGAFLFIVGRRQSNRGTAQKQRQLFKAGPPGSINLLPLTRPHLLIAPSALTLQRDESMMRSNPVNSSLLIMATS